LDQGGLRGPAVRAHHGSRLAGNSRMQFVMEPAAMSTLLSQTRLTYRRNANSSSPNDTGAVMIRTTCIATILFAVAASASMANARERHARLDPHGNLDALIFRYAAANNVPESLVRRVIHRESRGNPRAVSKGNYGLMQIRLGTARAMGYRGNARGLLDAETNMRYAVKYLAGAYRTAGGNADRAVRHYAAGYYYAAKRKGLLDRSKANPIGAFAEAAAGGGSVNQFKQVGKIKLTNDGKYIQVSEADTN
jgi:soluble lytic murein transglycosylase-like protein